MNTEAVVLSEPENISLRTLALDAPGPDDVVVDVDYSGISTGTERLLFTGAMPPFPGMGYPLVPGYESVGRISAAGEHSGRSVGEYVFVPGAACFGEVKGLFGGTASTLTVPGRRVMSFSDSLGDRAVLMALAATAYHVIASSPENAVPDLIVGHGVLGRLLARICVAVGGVPPVVWETNPVRSSGSDRYHVVHPDDDDRRDYRVICDVSGDPKLLDTLVMRMVKRGEIVLAGFYSQPLSFSFPPAFMKEARLRIASEWEPGDLTAVRSLVETGRLSLDGLITHHAPATDALNAYRTAFNDPTCLKMVLNWSGS